MASPDQLLAAAFAHHQAGRLAQAADLYQNILAQQPNHAQALRLLGLIACGSGNLPQGADLLRRAIAAHPAFAEAHHELGMAQHAMGQVEESIASLRRALELNARLMPAYNNLGYGLYSLKRYDEAAATFRSALLVQPSALFHTNLGNVLRELGRLDEAVAEYRQALRLEPNNGEIHYNLGNALKAQQKLDEAGEAYCIAIRLMPDNADAHNNLGNIFKAQALLEDAVASYRKAMALRPALGIYGSNLIFLLQFSPAFDAATIAAEQRRWNQQYALPLVKEIRPHANVPDPDRPIRVGYVSPDFRRHCQSFFTTPLFSHHDHANFHVTCYADVSQPDAITERLRSTSDQWRDICGKTDQQVAQMIRDDQIDILVDLTMHMQNNRLRLFAQKPAPVQVTWLAYPGSTGLDAIDYRLSDPQLDPPGTAATSLYSEKTVLLPRTFWCYDPLAEEPAVGDLPCLRRGSITFGCLNSFFKCNRDAIRLCSGVLQAVPGSRMLLLCPEGSHRAWVRTAFEQAGIAADRVELVRPRPRAEYLQLYQDIDIALDSIPYNGHTTSLDAFWMGVPVVTLVGSTIVGRAGLSQLTNLGLAELVATTPADYVRIVGELAADPGRLAAIRAGLRGRMKGSPLMDATGFARDIESAYRDMWRTWCSGRH